MEKINETISSAKTAVKDLIRQFQEKKLDPEPGRTMTETFENRVSQVHQCLDNNFHLVPV